MNIRGRSRSPNPREQIGHEATHCKLFKPALAAKDGANLRNFDPELIGSVRVRRVDGTEAWQIIDA